MEEGEAQAKSTNQSQSQEKKKQASPLVKVAVGIIMFIIIFAAIELLSNIWAHNQPGIRETTFTFVVESDTGWSGAFGTVQEGQRTEQGTGSASFVFHGSIASACVQKQTEWGYLRVKILRDGVVVTSQTTQASYGVVTVSASS